AVVLGGRTAQDVHPRAHVVARRYRAQRARGRAALLGCVEGVAARRVDRVATSQAQPRSRQGDRPRQQEHRRVVVGERRPGDRADCLRDRGLRADARREFMRAYALERGDTYAIYAIANLNIDAGDLAAAEPWLERARAIDDTGIEPLQSLANVARLKNDGKTQ